MKKWIVSFILASFLFSCSDSKDKMEGSENAEKSTADLPYTATYSSQFTSDVSDADLKMVLTTYKDWASGNMDGLEATMADSVYYEGSNGTSVHLAKADLRKMWTGYRDSLSSVEIEMQAWDKMFAKDKGEGHIVTWYKEIDTYKDGRVDSATYHDINRVKNGKITYYSSMKRVLK